MKRRTAIVTVLMVSLFLVSANSFGAGFVWEPTMSHYLKPGEIFVKPFYALDPLIAAGAGLGTGEGYGTTATDGIGNPFLGTTAYGGVAPANLAAQGINERPGHYSFGFANTYPNTDNFSAYELGNTPIQSGTYLNMYFRMESDDPINFIGICGGTDLEGINVSLAKTDGVTYLNIEVDTTNPVYSTKGGGDQDSVFGLYINYGNYDEGNVGVNYDSAIFRTNIHWWDIDVPAIPQDKLASIRLSTQNGTEAIVAASIPDSYFSDRGLNPNNVKGYVDEDELPLGQGLGETYSFEKMTPNGYLLGDVTHRFTIHSDQWSTHDIGVGEVPEPATMTLLALGGMAILKRRRRT